MRAPATCMLGDRPCNERTPCAAHVRWTAVQCAMRAPLRTTSIADLLEPPRVGQPLAGGDAGTHGRAAAAA